MNIVDQEPMWEAIPQEFVQDVGVVAYVSYYIAGQSLELQIDPVWDQEPIAVRIRAEKVFKCKVWSDTIGPIYPESNALTVLTISRVNLNDLEGFRNQDGVTRLMDQESNTSHVLSLNKIESGDCFHIQLYSDVTVDCLALDAALARIPLRPAGEY